MSNAEQKSGKGSIDMSVLLMGRNILSFLEKPFECCGQADILIENICKEYVLGQEKAMGRTSFPVF